MKIIKILIIITIILNSNLFSQNINEQKYKLAKSFEDNGKFEESLRLYKEIFQIDSDNLKYFSGIVRSYKGQNKYSELLEFVLKHKNKFKSPEISILLGELYWRTGDNKEANKIWEETLDEFKNPSAFLLLSKTQINLQLFNKAVETLKSGRRELKDNTLFSDELSKLYIATGNYQDGLDEIIYNLKVKGDIAQSQGRLFALMTNENANQYINNKLNEITNKETENYYLQQLYSWFLRTTGNLDKALEVTVRLDNIRKSQGRQVLYFANNARDDGQYDIASKAYSIIINEIKNKKYIPTALYGLSRTLEMKLLSNEDFTEEDIKRIIASYEKIIDDYKGSQYSAQAYLRLASLNYYVLNNNDEAVKYIEMLREEHKSYDLLYEAMNLLGTIYTGKEKFDKAADAFKFTLKRTNKSELRDEALYNLANIQFYKGNIDSSLVLYKELSSNNKSDYANDVLEKILLISSNKEVIKGLKMYGESEILQKAGKYDKAVQKLKNIAKEYPNDNIAQKSLKKAVQILFEENKYNETILLIDESLVKYPKIADKDYFYYIAGLTYRKLNKNEKSSDYLTKILVEFPKSIYLQEAREIIREIRKES